MGGDLESTAGDNRFNPVDKDFVRQESVRSIDIDHPKALEGMDSYELPASVFSIRTPIMWYITIVTMIKRLIFGKWVRVNSYWFDGISTICREVKDNSYSWKALEIIYNLPSYTKEKNVTDRIAKYWNGLENAKAVRNRLILTKKILKEEIISRGSEKIRILSIASGSARAVLETLSELRSLNNINFEFRLLDLDPTAVDYARKLSEELRISRYCQMINGSTTDLSELMKGYEPDIIEMVGFLEYRRKDKAVSLLKKLADLLAEDGRVIVSQIKPNREMYFLRWVMNWPMIYRTRKQFEHVLDSAGYDNTAIKEDPIHMHMVATYKKQ